MDVSLAALLGEDVYNFGELLLHPIVSRLLAAAAELRRNCEMARIHLSCITYLT